jgi:MarR family transcriptional regulator, organic hydroperoxide resistance regulator
MKSRTRVKGTRDEAARIVIAAQAEQMEQDLSGIRRALRRPLETEVSKGDLTLPQTAVMRVVVSHDGISLKDLSRAVSLAHSTVSGIVDRLEKRGMIERRVDPADGRVSRIHPSEVVTGWLRERMPALRRGPLEAALERATKAERETIGGAVKRLRELLEDA